MKPSDKPPGVDVCFNDLHFVAHMVARSFGCPNPESAGDIVGAAINQVTFELKAIADTLEREHPEDETHLLLLSISDRLEAAAETADILMKLHQLPHIGQSTRPAGAESAAAE